MQKIYGIVLACALVLISCQTASANTGESLPWGDFLLRVLNGAVFLGVLWYAAGKLIKKFFKDGRANIVQEMADLESRKQEAEAKLAEVERKIADVDAECARLLEEGKAQAEQMKNAILADAEAQAVRILEQAKRNAEQEGKAEFDAIRSEMADSICAALEKVLEVRLDAAAHQKLIDKSLTKVVLQ